MGWMPKIRVLILSGHSLFADGAASRLEEESADIESAILDPGMPDILARVVEFNPRVAIIDRDDPSLSGVITIPSIFRALPNLVMVIFDSQEEGIQILTSQFQNVGTIHGLIEALF